MIGIAANMIAETWHNFYVNWNLLYYIYIYIYLYIIYHLLLFSNRLREYRPPSNFNQFKIFTKNTFAMENFKKSMTTRT
jgi:hypothetical protein